MILIFYSDATGYIHDSIQPLFHKNGVAFSSNQLLALAILIKTAIPVHKFWNAHFHWRLCFESEITVHWCHFSESGLDVTRLHGFKLHLRLHFQGFLHHRDHVQQFFGFAIADVVDSVRRRVVKGVFVSRPGRGGEHCQDVQLAMGRHSDRDLAASR